jgi:ABC-type transport system involved in cytochrome c biogenesis permease component
MRVRNTILSILSLGFSYVAPAVLVIIEFATPNEAKYKLSLAGIVLFIAALIVAKRLFVRSFQSKMNDYLQDLANETTADGKAKVNAQINRHKITQAVIEHLDATLPLLVLMFATSWVGRWLQSMTGLFGMIWLSMTIGAAFAIWKKVGRRK